MNQAIGNKSNTHDLFDYWIANEKLPQIKSITANRKKHLSARMKEPFFRDHWKKAIDMIPSSTFLMGMNDRQWKADIDWFLKTDSVTMIIEGKYRSNSQSSKAAVDTGGRPPEPFL